MRSAYVVPAAILDNDEDEEMYKYTVTFDDQEEIYILNGGRPPVRVMRTYQLESGDNYTMEKQWFRGVFGESRIVEDRGRSQEYVKVQVTHLKCTPTMAESLATVEQEETTTTDAEPMRWYRLPDPQDMVVRFADIRLCSQSSTRWDPVSARQFPPKKGNEVAVWVDAHEGVPVRPMVATEGEVEPYWAVATALTDMLRDHIHNPEIRSKCRNYLKVIKEYILAPVHLTKVNELLEQNKWTERAKLDMENSTTTLSDEISAILTDTNNREVWGWIPDGEWLYHVQKKINNDIALFVMASDIDTSKVVFALQRRYVRLTAQFLSRSIFGDTEWPFPPFKVGQKVRYNNQVWVVQGVLDEKGSFGGYGNIPKYTLTRNNDTMEEVLGSLIYGEEPDKTDKCVALFEQVGNEESKQSEPKLSVYKSKSYVSGLGLLEMSNGISVNPTLVEIVHTPPTFVQGDHVVVRSEDHDDLLGNVEISVFSPDIVRYAIRYENTQDKRTSYVYRLASDEEAHEDNLRLHRKRGPVECGHPPSKEDGPRFEYGKRVWVKYSSTSNKPTVDWDDFRDVVLSSPYSDNRFESAFTAGFDSPLYVCTPSMERLMQEDELVNTPVFRWRAGMFVDIRSPDDGALPLSPGGSYAYDDDAPEVVSGGGNEIMDMSTYQRIRQSVWNLRAGETRTYDYGEKDSRLIGVVDTPSYVPQWNLRSASGVPLSQPLPAASGHHAKPTKAVQPSSNIMYAAASAAARLTRGVATAAYNLRYKYRLVGKIISVGDDAVANVLLRVPLGNNSEVVSPSKSTLQFFEVTVRMRLDVPTIWEERETVTTRPVGSADGDLSFIQMLYR